MLKRHSLAFPLSLLSCFFCLDSLFWHGLAGLNLVISTQHHYSAQIDFDLHEFKLFLFSHAWRYCHVFGIKWKEKMPLIMKHIVWLKLAWQWRYLTDKTGFLFIGTHCIWTSYYIIMLCTPQVLPDVLCLRQPGLCPSDPPEDPQLAAPLQVLPLDALLPWRVTLYCPHVHLQLVLCPGCYCSSSFHLQVHRVPRVSNVKYFDYCILINGFDRWSMLALQEEIWRNLGL